MSVNPKLFFLPRIPLVCKPTSQSLLFICSLFSSHWCCLALLTHLQIPSPSTGSWYHLLSIPPWTDLPSYPYGFLSLSSQPAQNIFPSWNFSAFPLRGGWGHGISKGFFLLLAFCFFLQQSRHIFSLFHPSKTRFPALWNRDSGDRCCHSSFLVSSIYPVGGGCTLCHLWMNFCLCKHLKFKVWLHKKVSNQTAVCCCWSCHPLVPTYSLWKYYSIIQKEKIFIHLNLMVVQILWT